MPVAILNDRGVLRVAGPDARKLLQGLLTNDLDRLDGAPLFAGLLSPQGKILFDFLLIAAPDGGVLLDCPRALATELARKLTFYKLRAAAEIADVSSSYVVAAGWNGATLPGLAYPDPRNPDLGLRCFASAPPPADADDSQYHAWRIAHGVPEGGRDYQYGDTFPHEALYDRLAGVSFDKGCYVGQEIVSRMQHRGTARKRILPVHATTALPPAGTPVLAGDVAIGAMGSSAATDGLAMLRVDRVLEMREKSIPLTAADVPLSVDVPAWAIPGSAAP